MLLVRHINMFFQFYDIEKDKGTIVMLDGKTVTPLYVQLMNQIEEKYAAAFISQVKDSSLKARWQRHLG